MEVHRNTIQESLLGEQWRDVVDYEDLYLVSNYGRIFGLKNKIILKQNPIRGYCNVCLCKDNKPRTFRVHRLLAFAWIPEVEGKPYINHKNGTRNDNRLENLEWCNNSENQLHSFRELNRVKLKPCLGKTGILCKNSKKVAQYTKDNELVKVWDSMTDPQRELGFIQSCISFACKRGTTSYGYYWKYA